MSQGASRSTLSVGTAFALSIALLSPACSSDQEVSYLERRAAFHTQLIRRGPAPQATEMAHYPNWSAPEERIREVRYPSGDMELRALLYEPEEAAGAPAPALVYLHGALQLSEHTISNTKPFIEAGFVVMAPAFRGEPGNPGFHEFVFGEADDAAAAIRWLAGQTFVDPERIYV
jgi:dipeptidyl aminopeptidase/acylaminoacyl peptidase